VSRRFLIMAGSLLLPGAILNAYAVHRRTVTSKEWLQQVELAKADAQRYHDQIIVPSVQRMSSGENLAGALQKLGLSPDQVHQATTAAQRAFNLRQLRAGNTLTVGRSVASAFERMFHLERACTMQVRTRMLGPVAYPVDPAVVDKNTRLLDNPERQELRSTTLVWPALLRKLDRIDPSFRN